MRRTRTMTCLSWARAVATISALIGCTKTTCFARVRFGPAVECYRHKNITKGGASLAAFTCPVFAWWRPELLRIAAAEPQAGAEKAAEKPPCPFWNFSKTARASYEPHGRLRKEIPQACRASASRSSSLVGPLNDSKTIAAASESSARI